MFFWLILTAFPIPAQTLQFEVASIKPLNTVDGRCMVAGAIWRPSSPSRVSILCTRLRELIFQAYPRFGHRIKGGNGLDDFYSLEAVLPSGSTLEQMPEMFGNLLAERFGLVFHSVTAKIPAYELVVGPGGFHPRVLADPNMAGRKPLDPRFAPPDDSTMIWTSKKLDDDTDRVQFRQRTMADLASQIASTYFASGVPVIDRTGIEGKFDFTFDDIRLGAEKQSLPSDAPVDPAEEMAAAMHLRSDALQKQLGLKINGIKIDGEVMVIDHIEKLRPEP